jgi:hypothetical protein
MIVDMARRRGDLMLSVIGGLLAAIGLLLGVVVAAGNQEFQSGLETVLVALGWAALFGAPGMLVLLGLRDRPSLLLAVGVILVPLSLLSFAGVLLPLLIPAVLLIVAYGRRAPASPQPRVPAGITAAIVVALLVGSAMALFVHQDPREYETPTYSEGTSDVVTGVEGLVMIGLAAAAVMVAWVFSAPRGPRVPATADAGRVGA